MEAGSRLRLVIVIAASIIGFDSSSAEAANYRTQNFLIQAPSQQLAQSVGQAAEKYRKDLATHWLGRALPAWPVPCPIRVVSGSNLAAQGVTTYNRAPVRDFQMEVVGTPERILDSVLPHEITHTILATHFGRPLPRWADEGICTTVEHISERSKHEAKLREFLSSRRGIAMNQLFLLTEYPSDVLPMYAQGYSVCRFFIDQKGPRTFINFLQDYMQNPSWTANVRKHYGYDSLRELQDYWLAWVDGGSGPVEKFAKAAVKPPVATVAATTPDNSRVALALNKASGERQPESTRIARNQARPKGAQTALAETVQQGWYSRQRDEANNKLVSKQTPAAKNVIEPIVPPSIRNSGRYSVSQPQGEQQISRAGVPVYEVINGGPVIRRWR